MARAIYPVPSSESRDHPIHMRLKAAEDEVARLRSAVVCSLTALVDLKDFSTGAHSTRLAEWAVRVGKLLGLSETAVRHVETASILHDIGKIGISGAILNKKGKLSDQELAEIKNHPEFGWGVLRDLPGFEPVAELVLYHHERVDGNGYPAGLKGEEIPLGACIVAVIDAYDAMTSTRAYRDGLDHDEAIRRLVADSGTQFEPSVVDCFCRVVKEELGVVIPAPERLALVDREIG